MITRFAPGVRCGYSQRILIGARIHAINISRVSKSAKTQNVEHWGQYKMVLNEANQYKTIVVCDKQ